MKVIFGTRGSKLAMAQTQEVMNKFTAAYPQHEAEYKIIETKGDKILDRALDQIGDKGLFVKEIERQLLDGTIHVGVHSMKDMPASLESGLCFTKTWEKEDARDVLILREASCLSDLAKGAVIATGSKRRAYQLQQLRKDIQIVGIRGNIDTRIRKMKELKLDGIVLAAAGLHRLKLTHLITQYLSVDEMVPACAQGKLALEIREDQKELKALLDHLGNDESDQEADIERQFLREVNGGCHIPVGAYAQILDQQVNFWAVLGNEEGTMLERRYYSSNKARAREMVSQCAHELLLTVNGEYHG